MHRCVQNDAAFHLNLTREIGKIDLGGVHNPKVTTKKHIENEYRWCQKCKPR